MLKQVKGFALSVADNEGPPAYGRNSVILPTILLELSLFRLYFGSK